MRCKSAQFDRVRIAKEVEKLNTQKDSPVKFNLLKAKSAKFAVSKYIPIQRIQKPFRKIKAGKQNETMKAVTNISDQLPEGQKIKQYIMKKFRIKEQQPKNYEVYVEGFIKQKLKQKVQEKLRKDLKKSIEKEIQRKIILPNQPLYRNSQTQIVRNKIFNKRFMQKSKSSKRKKSRKSVLRQRSIQKQVKKMINQMHKLKRKFKNNNWQAITPQKLFGKTFISDQDIHGKGL